MSKVRYPGRPGNRVSPVDIAQALKIQRLKSLQKKVITTAILGGVRPVSITVTEKAADEVRRVWQDQKFDESMFLRIGIAAGGCSGFSYSLKPDNQFDDTSDSKIDCHGVSVVVDKKSALYLEGTTLDWHDGLDRRGFTFDNPNVVKSCGCGSSFQA